VVELHPALIVVAEYKSEPDDSEPSSSAQCWSFMRLSFSDRWYGVSRTLSLQHDCDDDDKPESGLLVVGPSEGLEMLLVIIRILLATLPSSSLSSSSPLSLSR
jgi:hypothetical protein